MKKSYLVYSIVVVLLAMLVLSVYLYQIFYKKSPCLTDDIYVEYDIENNTNAEDRIHVVLKDNNKILSEFTESILSATHYHPVETRECGIYFNRKFNWDYDRLKPLPNFHAGLWKFNYLGEGEEIVDLEGYTYDFRVDPTEKYVTLERSFSGEPDHALVIKDIMTGEDELVVLAADVRSRSNGVFGTFDFLEWTEDGRYFWSKVSQGAHVFGWVRVDITDWSYEVYEAPEGILGGYPLNLKTGWIPVAPSGFWTGFAGDDEFFREQRMGRGITTASLYLYNVLTEEKFIVSTQPDPVWSGIPHKWLDETTLEYTLPDGEKAIFELTAG